MVSLFKKPYPKVLKNSLFWRQQGFPPARYTATNYKPAGGPAIKNQQLSQGSFLQKVAIAFSQKPRWFLYLKNPYPKAFKINFWRQQGFPPARCTANNCKPTGGHTIKNLQLSQGSSFPKGSNCIQKKAKVVSLFKILIQKLSNTAFFEGNKASPQQGVQQPIINLQEDIQ